MPQLNPAPWFLIWVSSWLIFLFTIPAVVMMFKRTNPLIKSQTLNPSDPWHWPWP
uniref:ATP synthase complex subunit 8 n=1 Tax=Cynoglossus joyneri TaxID=366923 RepID=A0A172QDL1_9PLEU|nr:ATP synthase F0 subunit 8 [Cynoglossus joyneri]AND82389.1 ATP synthase subunit 8 [Cynoglossus joyneri]ARK36814.1 ATP synthase subunit 8 [Cynoglossus joyneri]